MACPECQSPTISFSVPAKYREHLPNGAATVGFCTRCLTLSREALEGEEEAERDEAEREAQEEAVGERDEPSPEDPDFTRISDAFPTRPEAAIPLAIALDLSASLATNRSAIESLLRDVERAGTDPLLVIDRLRTDPSVEPAIDLERRQHQLEQLLY